MLFACPPGDLLASGGDKGEVLLWRHVALGVGQQLGNLEGSVAEGGCANTHVAGGFHVNTHAGLLWRHVALGAGQQLGNLEGSVAEGGCGNLLHM